MEKGATGSGVAEETGKDKSQKTGSRAKNEEQISKKTFANRGKRRESENT